MGVFIMFLYKYQVTRVKFYLSTFVFFSELINKHKYGILFVMFIYAHKGALDANAPIIACRLRVTACYLYLIGYLHVSAYVFQLFNHFFYIVYIYYVIIMTVFT